MGIKIVLCDDDNGFLSIVKNSLEVAGFNIVGIANNGEDAVNLVAEKQPDVLVLDIVMPKLDGMGVLEAIRRRNLCPNLKIVMLSAINVSRVISQAMKLGASYFITKPFSPDDLINTVNMLTSSEDVYVENDMGQNWAELTRTANNASVEAAKIETAREDINETFVGTGDTITQITNVLRKLNIPPHIKGYSYLKEGILIAIEDGTVLDAVTAKLYPAVAKTFDTTPSRVERAIRHALNVAWKKENNEYALRLFNSDKDAKKPTNAEFIAVIAERIRIENKM